MTKKTIAVIFGGKSAEHDVSIITALSSVIKPLKLLKHYNIVPVYIAKDGRWYSHESLAGIKTYQSDLDGFLKTQKPLALQFDNGLWLVWQGIRSKKLKIDVAFPAMHGTYGEDGSLMGLLRMANVPFVGCDMFASCVAMDKVLAKQVLNSQGLASVKFEWFYSYEYQEDSAKVLKQLAGLKYPLFVKPAHLGSSIGITKVDIPAELENAIEVAMHYDNKIIVEEGVSNLIEVTVPVLGNANPRVAVVEESIQNEDEGFYDFSQKYLKEGGKKGKGSKAYGIKDSPDGVLELAGRRLPAKLDAKLYKECEDVALDTYRVLGCEGTSRVDLLIDSKTKQVYVNEINTLPGSLFAHNWRMAGLTGVELVEELIKLAELRHADTAKYNHTFKSNFLSQF